MQKDIFDDLIVVKRSGQRVNFNSYKIAVAIKSAFDSVYDNSDESCINKIYEKVLKYIENNYENRKTINVEDIQDIIEAMLQEGKYFEVYTAFSEYRKKRAISRKIFTQKQQHKFLKAIEKINDDNVLISDNTFKLNDVVVKYGMTVINEITKSYIIDNKYLREHDEGTIFIHDMCNFSLGKLSNIHIDMNEYLKNNSFDSFIYYLKSLGTEISGEISIPALDNLLEQYCLQTFKKIYIEYLTNYLKVSGFDQYVNLNKIVEMVNKESDIMFEMSNYSIYMLSSQVENIFNQAYKDSFNKCKNDFYLNIKNLLCGLDATNKKYSFSFGTNYNHIGSCLNKIFIEVLNELNRLENVSAIFKYNQLNKDYLKEICSLVVNGKNIDIVNLNTSYNKSINEVEYFSDGVRIFENYNDDESSSNGRMVIAITSINFARLGLEFENDTIKNFYNKLDYVLETVKNELLLTFETVGNKNKDNYDYLFNRNVMSDQKLENGQKIRKVIKNGNLLIGLIGLKECINLLEKDESKQLSLLKDVLKFLNNKCLSYREETRLNFYINEPFESLASKELMTLDKSIYGIRKEIKNKCSYDSIYNLSILKDDYKSVGEIQKLIIGGSVYEIKLNKSISVGKLEELIITLFDSDVGMLKFRSKEVT